VTIVEVLESVDDWLDSLDDQIVGGEVLRRLVWGEGFAPLVRCITMHAERVGFGAGGSLRYPARKTRMSIDQFIDNEVKGNEVVLFMKGTPQFPMCGFSGQIVQILDNLGVAYKGLNVLENDELRQGIKTYSNWPTIPQLYVKGEFVGGCDIIREMFQSGELQSLLKDKGVATKAPATA
jgi:monothiol glutaredoxin